MSQPSVRTPPADVLLHETADFGIVYDLPVAVEPLFIYLDPVYLDLAPESQAVLDRPTFGFGWTSGSLKEIIKNFGDVFGDLDPEGEMTCISGVSVSG